jgi:tetratricopeptide (TPR) repeat protein
MTDETHIEGDFIQGDKVDGDKVMRDKHDHHHYPPPEFPLDNLPPANPNFTGRAALLDAIHSAFHNQNSAIAITQAIAGLGGVGKTQLALAYAQAHRDEYDLIWQMRADDPAALDGDLRALGMVLNLPVQTADAPTARQMVLSRLNGADWRWLLLYDNADQMDARSLRPYLPGGRGHVLITSRRRDWSGTAPVLVVNVFTPQEAEDFLLARSAHFSAPKPTEVGTTNEGTTNEEIRLLAEELGYLPLALEQAAAFMIKRQKDAAQYLALYRERRQEVWARETRPDDYHATVTTTWEMAFEYARQTPGAADLLNLCCFLAPDDIPLAMITAHAAALPEELAAVAGDEMALDDALAALQAYSLVTRTGAMLAMHRLVQTVARDRMGEEQGRIWAEAAIKLVLVTWSFDQNKVNTWAISNQLLPHLVTTADLATMLNIETSNTANLNGHINVYLNFLGDYNRAILFAERTLSTREKILGSDHPDIALSLNNLGILFQKMGNLLEAKLCFERALVIRENTLEPDHPHTALSLNNLGGILQEMGDHVAARLHYERALAINEKILGPDNPKTASILNNLGHLLQKMGDVTAALPYFERALTINEKTLGPDHPNTAPSLNNLGMLLKAIGKLTEAKPFLERALAINEKTLGPDHPDTANSLDNLGYLLSTMGKRGDARPYYKRALAIRKKVFGPDHPDIALSFNNLAILAFHMGDKAEAARLMQQAMVIYETRLGSQHPDTQSSRRSLEIIQSELNA